MGFRIRGVHHVQVTAPPGAVEACKRFYGGVLGLAEIPKAEGLHRPGAWYRLGGMELHVSMEEGPTDNPASRRHLCYEVDDLAEAERRLKEAGVEIIPDQQPIEAWVRFYVRDPAGNRVEFAQKR